jgi:glycosyltransferase (activator-dependent family)
MTRPLRILLVTNPEKSVFQYLVPMAWALRTAGHEIRVASRPAFTPVITGAGLTAMPVGRDRDHWRMAEMAPDEHQKSRAGVLTPYDVAEFPEKASWDYLNDGIATVLKEWHKMEAFPIVAELVEAARHWKPDLVIWEPTAFAAPIAAKACGAAHARMLFGIDVFGVTRDHHLRLLAERPGERTDLMADWMSGYGRRYGFDFTEDMITGNFTIDQFPTSLQTPANLTYLRTQYIPYGGPATIPHWLRTPPTRPRVALTLGLSATEVYDGYTLNIQDLLNALADLDIELIATIADTEKTKLTTIPPNARLVPYVPWHALTPTCNAVIHHAGAATLATTSRHPTPQLALHYHFDQPILARKLAQHGAGLAIHTSKATGDNVRTNLLRLLNEPTFTQRATDLSNEIHALPTPNHTTTTIEQLTAQYRTARS